MNFDFFIGPNGKPCAKPTYNGNITSDTFLEKLNDVAGVKNGTGQAVLSYLAEFLIDKLSMGATVTLDGIGTFGISTKISNAERKKLDGNSVELKRVTFRANPWLRKAIAKKLELRRVRATSRKSPNVPDIDQRKERLVKLLEKKPFITSTDYMSVARVCRSRAYDDLLAFEQGGIITSTRLGRAKIYSLKK